MAPTGSAIDMLLSLRTTIMLVFMSPMLSMASSAMPPVMEPSPMTATTFSPEPRKSLACAKPWAADRDVLAWPAPHRS